MRLRVHRTRRQAADAGAGGGARTAGVASADARRVPPPFRVAFYLLAAFATWMFALGPDPTFMGQRALYRAPYRPADASCRDSTGSACPARFWMMTLACLSVAGALAVHRLQRTRPPGRHRARGDRAAPRWMAATIPGARGAAAAALASRIVRAARPAVDGLRRRQRALPADVRPDPALQRFQRLSAAAL